MFSIHCAPLLVVFPPRGYRIKPTHHQKKKTEEEGEEEDDEEAAEAVTDEAATDLHPGSDTRRSGES